MKIIGVWCLIAQMKRQSTLITRQKKTLSDVPLLKKSRKPPKNGDFWKNGHFWEFFLIFSSTVHCTELRFLRCNQCVLALRLSYQTPPNNDFHFLAYYGFFFVRGVFETKNVFFCIFLTGMYRSSDLAGSKHNFLHYQHPTLKVLL